MSAKGQLDIFLVDDDKISLQTLRADIETTFKGRVIKIHPFSTGETCMMQFKLVMPEIVILDYYLNSKYPDAANGIQVLDWVKKENFETHVIMLTSEDHIDIALESFHHEASDYVVKTSTQFKKINYALSGIFKIMEAKQEARSYKIMAWALTICISFLVGGVFAISVFAPSLLK